MNDTDTASVGPSDDSPSTDQPAHELVLRVIDVMDKHNHPHTDGDMPYPMSLRGMAVAVIRTVRSYDAEAGA